MKTKRFYLFRSTCLDPINQNSAPAKDAQKSLSLFLRVCLELCWVRLLAITRSHKVETAATSVVYSSLLSKIRIYAEDLTIAATRATIGSVSSQLGEIFHKVFFSIGTVMRIHEWAVHAYWFLWPLHVMVWVHPKRLQLPIFSGWSPQIEISRIPRGKAVESVV